MWTKKNVTPVSDKAIKEMRFIYDNIKNGTLEHEQGSWHCDTAHCFAGWCEVISSQANKQHKSFTSINLDGKVFGISFYRKVVCPFLDIEFDSLTNGSAGRYAQKRWGLNSSEANELFGGCKSLGDINKILKKFEQGYRWTY